MSTETNLLIALLALSLVILAILLIPVWKLLFNSRVKGTKYNKLGR
ncbi:hypothetical protein MALL_0084, partial [Mycoplasmopsis alligatoris A21JP2]